MSNSREDPKITAFREYLQANDLDFRDYVHAALPEPSPDEYGCFDVAPFVAADNALLETIAKFCGEYIGEVYDMYWDMGEAQRTPPEVMAKFIQDAQESFDRELASSSCYYRKHPEAIPA